MRSHRVLVLYNEPVLPVNHPDADSEHEILYTVDAVSKTLVQAGFGVSRLGVSRDPQMLFVGLKEQQPDVVFNLFEGTGDQGITEAFVAGQLEWLGIPYTGSPFQTLCLARSKHLTKRLFQGAGLPTADFMVVEELPVPDCPLDWPVIVKPATQDASVGLDQGSVVTDQAQLNDRVSCLLQNYGPPVLIEQFIRGREFNVGLIEAPELRILPISEILFVDKDPGYWPIVTYDAKWKPGSRDYEATPPRYPADVSPKLAEKVAELSRQAYRLLGCRDYARVDFRVRPSGKPYLLEVNPNPDFSPTAGLAGGLASAGLTHAQFTVDLVRAALARGSKPAAVRAAKKTTVAIRPCREDDLDDIRQVTESCAVFRPETIPIELAALEAALENRQSSAYHGFVAEWNGALVGFASVSKVALTDSTYRLNWIAVAPRAQGQGLGRQLLLAVRRHVEEQRGHILVVETSSLPSFAQARQFFLRQGFRPVGEVPDYYRESETRLTYACYLDRASP